MLSNPEIYSRLRDGFVAVRLDWEQGNHYKDKFGFVLGTGDQMLLTPAGEPIPHDGPTKENRDQAVYGRHGRDIVGRLLDSVVTQHPPRRPEPPLKIDWFFWPRKTSAARPGGTYPVPFEAAAGYARLPLAIVEGPIPAALRDGAFLRRHVRQFIWVRGREDGPARIVVRRVKDGLKPGLPEQLAALDAMDTNNEQLGAALDAAWLAYMRDRPVVARGYLDNPHGAWMRGVKDQMLEEERLIRERAAAGTLMPPGRSDSDPKE